MKKILILICLLFGCTQNYLAPKYTFTATFLDAFTNQPVEGFGIYGVDVTYSGAISLTGSASTTLVNRISYSNKDGMASVAFNRYRKARNYEFFYPSNDKKYFSPVNENIEASEYDTFKNIKKTYKLNSKAQLRVKVNLKTPLKDGDKIWILVGAGFGGLTITNKYVDDKQIYESTGNVPMDVVNIYTINGVETRKREILTLKPFVVNDYEFTY